MGLPAILAGVGVVSSLFSGLTGQQAADKERKRAKKMLKARMSGPEAQALKKIFGEEMGMLESLPGELKRAREGRLGTQAAERLKRFRRSLAASGASGASFAGQKGDIMSGESTERMRREAELAEKQALSRIRGRTAQLGERLLNLQYPSPNALLGPATESSFYNPMEALNAGAAGYLTGQMLTPGDTTSIHGMGYTHGGLTDIFNTQPDVYNGGAITGTPVGGQDFLQNIFNPAGQYPAPVSGPVQGPQQFVPTGSNIDIFANPFKR